MKESVRILRFALVGTLNALITALVIWVMMGELGVNYLWSNIAGYIAALINNFFWSKYWVFTSRKGFLKTEIPLFLIAFGCAYGAQFAALLVMVEWFSMNAYLAQFLGLFVYGAVNFIMNRKLTFKSH
ncbi:MAG: GtrA family protein [Tannerellaceae bacterium]